MKISAFINAYNEEQELPSLFENLKDVDNILLVDHNSTDKTATIAKKLGARVITRPVVTEKVTKGDVEAYRKRLGFLPHFKEGDTINNWAEDFNQSMELIKDDWVLWIDCDERITWNRKEVEKIMPDADIISCKFINGRNEDKTEKSSFLTKKLFRKNANWFVCHIHTIVMGFNSREVQTENMTIEHYQKPKVYRNLYLPEMEYTFLKEQSSRINYYVARGYFHHSEFEKALTLFKIYLPTSNYLPEICKAYTMMAGCYWELGNKEESFNTLFKAMRVFPYIKLPFEMMANIMDMIKPEDAKIWRKFAAQISSNENI